MKLPYILVDLKRVLQRWESPLLQSIRSHSLQVIPTLSSSLLRSMPSEYTSSSAIGRHSPYQWLDVVLTSVTADTFLERAAMQKARPSGMVES